MIFLKIKNLISYKNNKENLKLPFTIIVKSFNLHLIHLELLLIVSKFNSS